MPDNMPSQSITVTLKAEDGPQLWYGDGFWAYRIDVDQPGTGLLRAEVATVDRRQLALIKALLTVALARVERAEENAELM